MQAVDFKLIADLGQHLGLDAAGAPVRGRDIAGQHIGSVEQLFGQRLAHEAEQRVQPVLFLEKRDHRLRHRADAVDVVIGKDRRVIDRALDGDQLGRAQVLVRGRDRHHHRDQRVAGGE